MSILIANLKHLYQKKINWLIIPLLCLFAFRTPVGIIEFDKSKDPFDLIILLFWLFFTTMFLTTLIVETLPKPFSYCLPGHKSIPRKLLFMIGFSLSFLLSLVFLFNSEGNQLQIFLNFLSAFSALIIIYWLSVWIVATNHKIGLLIIPLMYFMETRNFMLSTITDIVENPLLLIPMAIATNFLAWKYWGRPNLAREYFDRPTVNNSRKFINAKLTETFRKKPHSITTPSFIENLFISQIARAKSGSLKKYAQGLFYETIGLMLSEKRRFWITFSIVILPLLYCISYFPNDLNTILCCIFLLITLSNVDLRVQSNLLISGGRKERFYSALTLAITISAAIALLALLAQILHTTLPAPTFLASERKLALNNSNPLILYSLPQLIIPLSLTISILYQLKRTPARLLIIAIFAVTFIIAFFPLFVSGNWTTTNWLIFAAIAIPFTWAIFIATLRYITTRTCLTKISTI